MEINTEKFGLVEIVESGVIEFKAAIFGLSAIRKFALIQPKKDSVWFWLQALHYPETALCVTSPAYWVPNYEVLITDKELRNLGSRMSENVRILALATKQLNTVTLNLRRPLLVDLERGYGMQLILWKEGWSNEHPIGNIEI